MTNSLLTKASIIEFWRAVELFAPQSAPRVNPQDANEPVFVLHSDSLPPWHPDHSLQRREIDPKLTWRHQVYCGIFNLATILQLLEDKIGHDPNSPGEYPNQESAVCTFTVSNNGVYLKDSLVISTCAWACARTVSPGPQKPEWLSGFDVLAAKIAGDFLSTITESQEDNIEAEKGSFFESTIRSSKNSLSSEQIFNSAARIVAALGAYSFIDNLIVRVKSYRVSTRKQDILDESDSLNSFFVHDLELVKSAILASKIGAGLSNYLDPRNADLIKSRIDVHQNRETTYRLLNPALFPQGRWPSKGKHPLFLSQQLAVNWIMATRSNSNGLASVNGPPGTGKTTLIRDLIAAIVVERAKLLATLLNPDQAFAEATENWTENNYTRSISFFHDALLGNEMVVASTNNGAVENVVLEIPGIDAVDLSYSQEDHYFADFATRLLGKPAWALMAARLGNKTNRNAFANQFWYTGGYSDQNSSARTGGSFLDYLRVRREGALEWAVCTSRFKDALVKEEKLRRQRQVIYQLVLEIGSLRQNINESTRLLNEAIDGRSPIVEELSSFETKLIFATRAVESAIEDRRLHREFRPGFLQIVFTMGKSLREWQQKDKQLEDHINIEKQKQTLIRQSLDEIQNRLKAYDFELAKKRRENSDLENQLITKSTQVSESESWLGQYLLTPELVDQSETRERAYPWSDPEWNEARISVFIEALQLHRAFIHYNARRLRDNLTVLMDILTGKTQHRISSKAAQHAWASLFFVIPVISTTFASFDRLFRHLECEQLGWLIIDEAGQATPQAAVGAIWRAKRTIALGDPLQLQPVFTLPLKVQNTLRTHYNVSPDWVPGTTSVQGLVDRVNPVGANVDLRSGTTWVGAPLRVHKRCDRPMFDISNIVAYAEQMVFATPSRPVIDLPPSRWIDVVSNQADDHWIPAEGVALRKLLLELYENESNFDSILLISPFRSVARQLGPLTRAYSNIRAGTIHVAQGKEADIVILVLGGNPERPGAKRWASAQPNLVNVAASRAKRRLYVIGNKAEWAKYPHFADMAAILEQSGAPLK